MKKRLHHYLICMLVAGFVVIFSQTLVAGKESAVGWIQPGSKWVSFSTEHFRFTYLESHQLQAERAAAISEKAWNVITNDLNWKPVDKIEVVLVDDFDFSNGFASPLPYNHIRLFLSPPDGAGGLDSYDDWLNLLITHELTHIVHLDMAADAPALLRKILGRNFLTFPHAFTPGFMVEGLAVFKETNRAMGFGRGQSTGYEMLMRQEVLNGLDDLSQIVLPRHDWPFGKQYLYGYYYYQFLAETYGEREITRYLNNYSRTLLPFFLQNRYARNTFGKNHETLWIEFKQWLETRFEGQINRIRQQPLVTGEEIVENSLHLVPRTANQDFYYFLDDNGEDRRAITRMNQSGQLKTILSVPDLIDMDVNDSNDIAFTRLVDRADGRAWADLFILKNSQVQRITIDRRYRNPRWLNSGSQLVAKRIDAGYSQLDLISPNGDLVRTLWRGTLDDVIGDFDVSHDASFIIASIKRKQQGWNLEKFDIKKDQWNRITNTRAIESDPRISDDDRNILFSADYGETFNLYTMEISTGEVKQLSHVLGGAMKPVQSGEHIFYQNYGANGYRHFRLAASNTLSSFNITDKIDYFDYPDRFEDQPVRSPITDYQPWSTLSPREWFPVLDKTIHRNNIGLTTNGTDALDRHSYLTTLVRDTDNDVNAGNLIYFYDKKWQLLAQRSYRYRTIAGDNLNIRQEDFLELARINMFNSFENTLKFSLGIVTDKNRDLVSSGLTAQYPATVTGLLGARLDFDNLESYSQSNGPSWGSQWSLIWESNEYIDSDFSGDVINLQFSQFFDLPGNHVMVFHTAAGYGFDQPETFFLGGESSVFNQSLFGRNTWFLRGYDEGVQFGTRIQTNSIEYRLPLATIEKNWDLLPIGLGNLSLNVFVDHGAAWQAGNKADYLTAVGVEFNAEIVLGYGLELPTQLGIAYGLDDDVGGSRSYLRIGYTF